jgi:hypothetical protein
MKGVLTSRHFIYLVEGEPEVPRTAQRLGTGFAALVFPLEFDARRRLFAAAESGCADLERRDGLENEVDRMLTDSRINRFVDDFSRQWLQLHRVGMFPPDKGLYPKYDDWLENEHAQRGRRVLPRDVRQEHAVDEFIDSDWTMANARLCDFYGLPEPKSGALSVSRSSPRIIAAVC